MNSVCVSLTRSLVTSAGWTQTSLNVLVDSGFVVWILPTLSYVPIHRSFSLFRPPTKQLRCFAPAIFVPRHLPFDAPPTRGEHEQKEQISSNQREMIEISVNIVNIFLLIRTSALWLIWLRIDSDQARSITLLWLMILNIPCNRS